VIEKFCTFPLLEKRKLFRRVLFCFLTGNEDMHLKNFSLITRGNKIALSPAYDFLNSTISMARVSEEMALPLAGKKRHIKSKHLLDYYAREKMKLTAKTIQSELENLVNKKLDLEKLISVSFLTDEMKEMYLELISARYKRLID
jgi:serine/threonine-protein kinase HipA